MPKYTDCSGLNASGRHSSPKMIKLYSLIVWASCGLGCQGAMETKNQELATKAAESIECSDVTNKNIFQTMAEMNLEKGISDHFVAEDKHSKIATHKELKAILWQRIHRRSHSRDEQLKLSLAEKTANLIQLLDHDVKLLDNDEYETQLARLENGSRITEDYAKLSFKANQLLSETQLLSQAAGLGCELPPNPAPDTTPATPPESLTQFPTHLKNALRWTMSTAYQSCESVKLKPVDKTVENVQGIVKNESTWGRSYSNIPLIVKTNHYLRNMTYPKNCLDVSKKPLVYDYGGVAEFKNNLLNIFVNKGGGSALGIDCSAFASAAAATAGLLYRKNTQTKPVYTRYTTRDFVDPVKSNWDCYAKVAVNSNTSILPGDLAIISGHMVGIDSVEKDPFGISGITDISQCNSLTTNQFHFVLIQSSASKGSLGINRYLASDYANETADIKTLFLGYAKAACQAKFSGKSIVPTLNSSMSIIRHSGTPECKAQRVPLVNEKCIADCIENFSL
jgi:hypothetical protein